MENNTPTVTPKMEYWGWVLSIFATILTVIWISYQAINDFKGRKASD
jgi:hypothetical protein